MYADTYVDLVISIKWVFVQASVINFKQALLRMDLNGRKQTNKLTNERTDGRTKGLVSSDSIIILSLNIVIILGLNLDSNVIYWIFLKNEAKSKCYISSLLSFFLFFLITNKG